MGYVMEAIASITYSDRAHTALNGWYILDDLYGGMVKDIYLEELNAPPFLL